MTYWAIDAASIAFPSLDATRFPSSFLSDAVGDKGVGMAAEAGSHGHAGVGAGGVDALQACGAHSTSAGVETAPAPLESKAAVVPEENLHAQAKASLSIVLPKRAHRRKPPRMSLPALRVIREAQAEKDNAHIWAGGGYGGEGSKKSQTDKAKVNLQVDVVMPGGMYYYEEDLQDVQVRWPRTGASRFQTPKFSRALSRSALKLARFLEDEDSSSALTLDGAIHQSADPITSVLAPTPEGVLLSTVEKERGSSRQKGTKALQRAGMGLAQEEDETQGWVPYYLTPRTKQAFVVHRRRMKKVQSCSKKVKV